MWGDDITSTRLAFPTDFADAGDVCRPWVPGLAGTTGRSRAPGTGPTTLVAGRKVDAEEPAATSEVARDAARRLGLPESVQTSLLHVLAMWNGKGHPPTAGDSIPLSTRVMHVAAAAVLFLAHAGPPTAVAQVRHRPGSYLDPEFAAAFVDHAGELLDGIDEVDLYQQVLDSEPDPVRVVDGGELEDVARTFGDLVDLKSPWLQGHSSGVADLASAAAASLRLDDHVRRVRVAGYLHDIGRVGVCPAASGTRPTR